MSITFLTYAFLTKSSKSPASIAKSKRASERLLESSTKYLEEKLKLTVNREKLNEILTGYFHYYIRWEVFHVIYFVNTVIQQNGLANVVFGVLLTA